MTRLEYLTSEVLRHGTTKEECMVWPHFIDSDGYGVLSKDGKNAKVHRVSYAILKGAIPYGLQLDHTCHNATDCQLGIRCPHRACFNPAHLEVVTTQENQLRAVGRGFQKPYCPQGHSYDDANTRYETHLTGRVSRKCKICDRDRARLKRALAHGN